MEEKMLHRKIYLLKNSSQPALILKTYAILVIVMLVAGAVFYFIGNKDLTREYFQAHSVIKTTMQLLLPALILVNFLGLLVAFLMVITFTHSIAGPVYQLKMLSQRLKDGDLTVNVRFRKGDALHELSDIINRIIAGLHEKFADIQVTEMKLRALSTRVRTDSSASSGDFEDIKKDLLSISNELEEKLRKIKL